MRTKAVSAEKSKESSRYLEVHIRENGAVIFSNLSAKELKLIENISGLKHQPRDFYCG